MYVHEKVYRELLAAADAGTRIVVDSYCRQSYPQMTQPQDEIRVLVDLPAGEAGRVLRGGPGLARRAPRILAAGAGRVRAGERGPAVGQTHAKPTGSSTWSWSTTTARRGPTVSGRRSQIGKPYGQPQTARVSIAAPTGSAVLRVPSLRNRCPRRSGTGGWRWTSPCRAGRGAAALCLSRCVREAGSDRSACLHPRGRRGASGDAAGR